VGQLLSPGLLYPWYPQAGGWVAAKPMRILDKMETSSGNWITILWTSHLQPNDCRYGIMPELLQLACYCMLVLSFLFLYIRLTTLLHSHLAIQYHPRSDIWGSYSAIYEHSRLMRYDAVSLGEWLPMSSNPWSSWLLGPWWRHYILLKHRDPHTQQHSFMSQQKIGILSKIIPMSTPSTSLNF
jgi:hypothetical protein